MLCVHTCADSEPLAAILSLLLLPQRPHFSSVRHAALLHNAHNISHFFINQYTQQQTWRHETRVKEFATENKCGRRCTEKTKKLQCLWKLGERVERVLVRGKLVSMTHLWFYWIVIWVWEKRVWTSSSYRILSWIWTFQLKIIWFGEFDDWWQLHIVFDVWWKRFMVSLIFSMLQSTF